MHLVYRHWKRILPRQEQALWNRGLVQNPQRGSRLENTNLQEDKTLKSLDFTQEELNGFRLLMIRDDVNYRLWRFQKTTIPRVAESQGDS